MVNSYSPRHGSPLGRVLSMIEIDDIPIRFLILDCPTESTLPYYIDEFKRNNVKAVVRCCQETYKASTLAEYGIQVYDLPFKDGGVPSTPNIREWLDLVRTHIHLAKEDDLSDIPITIAVHCVAGLGRAPVLVAIALIELCMEPLDAIAYIREKRRGAFNRPQIAFLDSYKRTMKTKPSSSTSFRVSLGKMFKFGSGGTAGKKEVAIH